MNQIKLLVMDVDGTLTDGRIYIGNTGELFKAFSVKDGLGIKKLKSFGIIPVIITGRQSDIVSQRANELGIVEFYQGIENKLELLKTILIKHHLTLDHVAYIGDDENDLDCIRVCKLSACPRDAAKVIKPYCNFCSDYNGGEGAVRDFIEFILKEGE